MFSEYHRNQADFKVKEDAVAFIGEEWVALIDSLAWLTRSSLTHSITFWGSENVNSAVL